MMIYLTYAEPPSGVYSSQVADVILYLNREMKSNIRLVAFISLHDFNKQRLKIRSLVNDAIVLPMLPKADYWKFNSFIFGLICFFLRPEAVMARNVIAANMAIAAKSLGRFKKICFDGRGAIAAEWHEYDVTVPMSWKSNIDRLESIAVHNVDFRIAVSEKLVDYWTKRYGYTNNQHVIIPCTLNSGFRNLHFSKESFDLTRKKYQLNENDVVLAYAGSVAGWQSFSSLAALLTAFLTLSTANKVIFLAPADENIDRLTAAFPEQVIRVWVNHDEVNIILQACDWGILIREQSVTNQVASPTKFAEYLAAGLPVIISEQLGDYTQFVHGHLCGVIIDTSQTMPVLTKQTIERKKEISLLAEKHFTKQAYNNQYKKLLFSLKPESSN